MTAEPLSDEELAEMRAYVQYGTVWGATEAMERFKRLLATIDARDAEIERLHGAMAPFAASAVKHGDATINDVRAAIGLPAWVPG